MNHWSVQQLAQVLREAPESIQLIDVREADEWAIARIEGATLIPLSTFAERGPAEITRDRPAVIYCHHGMRSAQAQGYLLGQGFPEVINLSGGIDAWSREIDPQVPRY